MIVTAKPRIPFLWQLAIAAPWGVLRFKYMVIGGVFIFSLKKFIENPAGITFIMSIPAILSIAVNPVCSFMSDRIWTRWGRRKPFVVPSMLGVVLAFILMPLMPNMWALLAVYLLYQISHDFGLGATDTIKQEVVPPKQRGTAAAIGTWLQNIFNLGFYLIALGRFDDYKFYAGFPITGEESIYWGISTAILMMALLMMLGVKETEQPSKFRGQRFTLHNFFGGLLNRNLWPVYLLITGWSVANAGLGALGALLYTEQWGFSKQEMGINVAVGSMINIFLIALIGTFADKLPRMKTFKILLFVSILIELSFYLYVEFVLFDKTPTLPEVILFGEIASIAGILLGMLYMPLVYDYIPRNEMGTFSAGSVLVGKIVQVITLNGVGIFVTLYSSVFMPPGGDMTRVVMDQRTTEAEIRTTLAAENPLLGQTNALSVEAWYATNAALDSGHAFEIRRPNPESLALKKEIEKISEELKGVLVHKSNAEADAERARIAGDEAGAARADEQVEELSREAAPLEKQIAELRATQSANAEDFREDVLSALNERLLVPGTQILAAGVEPATVFEFPLSDRPSDKKMAATLDRMRLRYPAELIDLRVAYRNGQFFLEAAVRGDEVNPDFAKRFAADLKAVAGPRIGSALGEIPSAPEGRLVESMVLDLRVVEDPINTISPITKVIYGIWEMVGDAPLPERRLWATGRALRQDGETPLVGAWNISSPKTYAIRLQAVLPATDSAAPQPPAGPAGPTADRLATLMGASNPALPALENFYDRAVEAAAQNKLTVPNAVLKSDFAPPRYDYMSGYLWMVIMSSIGLLICLLFTRREEKGLIRKRGREESEDEARAEEAAAAAPASARAEVRLYRPGYVPQKILMTVFGLVMVGIGLVQIGPFINLTLFGNSATAVATQVVKERRGGEPRILRSDTEVEASVERYDRSFIFWNHFEFTDSSGASHEIRGTTGQQLRPKYELMDDDGLPTTITVRYDADNPAHFVIPGSYSTWFLGGLFVLFGLIGAIFGAILLYYANKPIELPIVHPKDAPDDAAQSTK